MNKALLEKLEKHGEYYLSGFLSGETVCERYANALVNAFDHAELPKYDGGLIYPNGENTFYPQGKALVFHYSYPLSFFPCVLDGYTELTADEREEIINTIRGYYVCGDEINARRCLGGRGFNHFVPDYAGILAHGLDKAESDAKKHDNEFCYNLLRVIAAVRRLTDKIVAEIEKCPCDNGKRLIGAYRTVPFSPACDFLSAVICINYIYRLDGCDSLGGLDRYLTPYFDGDGEMAYALIRALFEGANVTHCWSCMVGGEGHYNELTDICLKAIRTLASPNLSLKVSDDMPAHIWDTALDTIAGGGGMPSLYNEKTYVDQLMRCGVPAADAKQFVLGGCTETMIAGDCNCGSIDAGVNLVEILNDTVYKSTACDFDGFIGEYFAAIDREIVDTAKEVRADKARKAKEVPQFMRSLFCKHCAERGRHFNDGGAEYTFSVINVCGFANAVDSLAAIDSLCFANGKFSLNELRGFMGGDATGDYSNAVRAVPKFGNDDEKTNDIARSLSRRVFGKIVDCSDDKVKFFPASIMFSCYAEIGSRTGASPDGRACGEPLADSGGAYQGRDTRGVTALLNSCLHVEQSLSTGTWVVNVRLSDVFRSDNARGAVKALIKTYFAGGGMQLQINRVDQKTLVDAYDHPERHGDLVIRLGGYSDYFVKLDRSLQQSILSRNEHAIK